MIVFKYCSEPQTFIWETFLFIILKYLRVLALNLYLVKMGYSYKRLGPLNEGNKDLLSLYFGAMRYSVMCRRITST